MKEILGKSTTNETFPLLAAEIVANGERNKENTAYYIYNGYMPTWGEEYRTNPDRGIKKYSTETRWNQYQTGKISREKAVELATTRAAREIEKSTAEKLKKLNRVAAAGLLEYGAIYVTWKRSTVWGYNPTAEFYPDGADETIGKASGCGYDKESAAVGESLDKSPAALKVLYTLAEKALADGAEPYLDGDKTRYGWGKAISYGAGYSVLPYFEGGVGVRCFWKILEKAGYTVREHGTKYATTYIINKRGE